MASSKVRRRANRLARPQLRASQTALRGQVRGVKRDTRATVRSIQSEQNPLMSAVSGARQDLLHAPGLSGRDQRLALEMLAGQRTNIAGGLAAQEQAARGDAASQLVDLRSQALAGQQQAEADALAQVQGQVASARAARSQARLTSNLSFENAIKEAAAKGELGAQQGASTGVGALTPLQQREVSQKRQDALSLVRAAYDESVQGAQGAPPAPKSPQDWQQWGDLLYGKYKTTVDRPDIQWAIGHLAGQSLHAGADVTRAAAPQVGLALIQALMGGGR